jgi:hypothetical protein
MGQMCVNQWTAEAPFLRFVTRIRLVKARQRNSHCGGLLPSKASDSSLRRQCGVIYSVEISSSVIVICSYDL